MALKPPLLSEPVVELIMDTLKDNFNNTLQQSDFQYSDGINLEPASTESFYISSKFQTLDPPGIYVLFGDMAFDYTDEPNYLISNDSVVVVVSGQDVGADVLTKKMWRYARVLFSILGNQDFVSSDGRIKIHTVPKKIGYSDVQVAAKLNASEKYYRQDCVLELEVKHYERLLTN